MFVARQVRSTASQALGSGAETCLNDSYRELLIQQNCNLTTREASGQEPWLICYANICPGLLLDTQVTKGDCLPKLWNTVLYMKPPNLNQARDNKDLSQER